MRRGEPGGVRWPRRGLEVGGFLSLAGALLVLAACAAEGENRARAGSSSPAQRVATSGAQPSPAASGATSLEVRVASFNVRWEGLDDGPDAWEQRRDLVAKVLRQESPDSVGLQEPSPRQVDDILSALPHHAAFTYDRSTEPILYRTDRFRLAESGGFLLFAGTALPGSRRTCTWVRLIEIKTGRAYYHYNVHLDHRLQDSRWTSARRLSEQIAARSHLDPLVVTGDFNAREDSPTLSFLKGEGSVRDEKDVPFESALPLVDTFRVVSPDATAGTTRGVLGIGRGRKIDYVLVEPTTEVIEARILTDPIDGRYPSDHFPVTARVRWR